MRVVKWLNFQRQSSKGTYRETRGHPSRARGKTADSCRMRNKIQTASSNAHSQEWLCHMGREVVVLASFVAESDHGVDAHGTARGDVAR